MLFSILACIQMYKKSICTAHYGNVSNVVGVGSIVLAKSWFCVKVIL